MYLKSLMTLMLILLSLQISFCDKIRKKFNAERNIPTLKVSLYNPNKQQPQQDQSQKKVIRVNNGSEKITAKFKRENMDNVKGELRPQSREDIYNIKKLKFHGRSSPNPPEALIRTNQTSKAAIYSEPIQRNDYYIPSSYKSSKPIKKILPRSNENHIAAHSKPRYVPHSDKFYPLMRPSPINLMPTEPPTFDTVRNYVRYLKMRQQKFFSDFDDDNKDLNEGKEHRKNVDNVKPTEIAQPKISVPYGGEIDYFKEREQELAREEEQRNQFSPTSELGLSRMSENVYNFDVRHNPYREVNESASSNESEMTTSNNYDNQNEYYQDESEEHESVSSSPRVVKGRKEVQEYYDEQGDYDGDTVFKSESKRKEYFEPFRMYAQVRHIESKRHEKPRKKNIKEKISLAKNNIYYKEEGYEDKNYDHGADALDYNYDEHIEDYKPKRVKRATTNNDPLLDVSQLPVALAYIKKSELPNLTGVKLLKHLDELLKNSSIYLPDDEDTLYPIKIAKPKKSQKFPYYNFPETVLSQMSAHRYSENLENYPRQKESLYKYKNIRDCDEIEDDLDPVPSDIEEKHKLTRFNDKPRRLRGLDGKIGCLREKYFGKEPFNNPLFHEDEYVTATIPIPVNHNLSRQVNPLITVYDDVIHNIRTGFLDEFKKKREADASKVASEQISIRAEQTKIPNLSAVSSVGNSFPLFDINLFIPKFKGAINLDPSDEFDDLDDIKKDGSAAAELLKINKQQLLLENEKLKNTTDKKLESMEKSKFKRNNKYLSSDSIENISPPLLPKTPIKTFQTLKIVKAPQKAIQKFRRIIPNNIVHSAKHISTIYLPEQPDSKTTYRFKLL